MGVVLAIVLFAISYAISYFEKGSPRLRIEEVSRANVIDLKEEVSDLAISYKGVNLRSNHQTLAVVTLKISNDGAASISKPNYDDLAPVGVIVSKRGSGLDSRLSGTVPTITKAEFMGASAEYLSNTVTLSFSSTNATLNPVIIDPGDFIRIKLLVLHGEDNDFAIRSTGKIAGVKEIKFVSLNASTEAATTHGIRVETFVGICGSAAVLFAVIAVVFSVIGIHKRKKALDTFRRSSPRPAIAGKYVWVADYYVGHGKTALSIIQKLMAATPSDFDDILFSSTWASSNKHLQKTIADQMQKTQAVIRENNSLKVDETFRKLVEVLSAL
jgi:hypothetical protein